MQHYEKTIGKVKYKPQRQMTNKKNSAIADKPRDATAWLTSYNTPLPICDTMPNLVVLR